MTAVVAVVSLLVASVGASCEPFATATEPEPCVVELGGEQVPCALDLDTWGRLAGCESGGDWHIYGRTYSGGVQFTDSTWRSVGGDGRAGDAPVAEQIDRARILLTRSGWGQWPACSRRLGF